MDASQKISKTIPKKALALDSKKITIVGSGFVGKTTGKGLMTKGHTCIFSDINENLIDSLKGEGLTAYSMGAEHTYNSDIYMVSVLTPTINEHLDFRFIDSALTSLGRVIKKSNNWPIIVIRSTVLPGTTEKRFIPLLEKYSGKTAGKDFGISMNPEFLREVSAEQDFMHPWYIVIGSNDPKVGQTLEEIYRPFNAPIVHMSIREAEAMKYIHNIYNANKISFFNEMREVIGSLGIDTEKIFNAVIQSAEASWNPKYGTKDKGPFGGSCLPKDTLAFLNWAKDTMKKKMPLLHGVIKVNEDLKDKEYLEH